MRERMHPAVAASEKGAQDPAHDADQDRAPESAAETVDMEAMHELIYEQKHESVDDKDENAKSENDQRRHEQKENGTEESIKDSKEERGADKRRCAIITNATYERRRDHDGHGRDCPSENKMSHPKMTTVPSGFHLPARPLVGKGLAVLKQK
jgi:hypothetical protein